MLYWCYLRKGIAYVPIVARVTAGYYMQQEPVAVVPVSNTHALREALKHAIGRGNPIVPTPTRANMPPGLFPEYGVKDWNTFVRSATSWKIRRQDGVCEIIRGKKVAGGSFVDDPDRTVALPAEATMDDAVDRLVTLMQESVHEQRTPGKTRS